MEPSKKRVKQEEVKMKAIKNFFANEEGLETVEYAVMTALIVGVLITAISGLSASVSTRMDETATVIDGMNSTP